VKKIKACIQLRPERGFVTGSDLEPALVGRVAPRAPLRVRSKIKAGFKGVCQT
jgi:hypothetical protein